VSVHTWDARKQLATATTNAAYGGSITASANHSLAVAILITAYKSKEHVHV